MHNHRQLQVLIVTPCSQTLSPSLLAPGLPPSHQDCQHLTNGIDAVTYTPKNLSIDPESCTIFPLKPHFSRDCFNTAPFNTRLRIDIHTRSHHS
jgi:hypothetical protein